MLCDDCKQNPACVHLTQISNTEKIDRHLCEECAKKYGELILNMNQNFSVNDFLAGIFNSGIGAPEEEEAEESQSPALVCPNCEMAYQDFQRTGKIGCGVCYTTFEKRLEPLLRRIHGASSHTGKIPRRSGGAMQLRQEIGSLRKKLGACVEKEEYEQAANFRDRIKKLEKQLAQEG